MCALGALSLYRNATNKGKKMNNLNTIQNVIISELAQSWFDSLFSSKANTWQRNEASTGLRGAIVLACKNAPDVQINLAKKLNDSTVFVNGSEIAFSMLRAA